MNLLNGTQSFTSDADIALGTSGHAVRVFSIQLLSGAAASTMKLYNGTHKNVSLFGQVDGVISKEKCVNYEGGKLFPAGCFVETDENIAFAEIVYREEFADPSPLTTAEKNFEALYNLGGLTFFKNYVGATTLDADYSVGSPIATYTSTSGTPTMTGGYNATTANADVLKYLIAGNRTAAQETIVIKFTPTGNFANDGVKRTILQNAITSSSNTDNRIIEKSTTSTVIGCFPAGFTGPSRDITTTPLNGVTYIYSLSCKYSGNPNLQVFINGIQEGANQNTDWTPPPWSTEFFIGSDRSGALQANMVIASITFFNRNLSTSEVLALNNLM